MHYPAPDGPSIRDDLFELAFFEAAKLFPYIVREDGREIIFEIERRRHGRKGVNFAELKSAVVDSFVGDTLRRSGYHSLIVRYANKMKRSKKKKTPEPPPAPVDTTNWNEIQRLCAAEAPLRVHEAHEDIITPDGTDLDYQPESVEGSEETRE